MTTHSIFLVLATQMSLLHVQEKFHLFVHVEPHVVLVLAMFPSLVCAAPVPFKVAPSIHATPSLFPPTSIFIFAFT